MDWRIPASILVFAAATAAAPAQTQRSEYRMDRKAEIALARSAAPSSISGQATILVLGPRGYETAASGSNGWVCGVERSWMNQFDSKDFWKPAIHGAVCYNPPAARTVVPLVRLRAELVMAGDSKEQILAGIKAAYAQNKIPALAAGAMSYMLSKQSYLTDSGSHDVAHLMFYVPLGRDDAWGADLPHSPVSRIPVFGGAPEPIVIYIVTAGTWSDGTPAR